jgi:hypothetical protein
MKWQGNETPSRFAVKLLKIKVVMEWKVDKMSSWSNEKLMK